MSFLWCGCHVAWRTKNVPTAILLLELHGILGYEYIFLTLWQRWRGGRDGGKGSCSRILWTEPWSVDLRLSTQRVWWDFAWPRRNMRPGTGLILPSINIGSIRVDSILQFPLFQNRPWHPHSFEATVLDENCIFWDAFFARSPNTSCSKGTTQTDRVVTTTKAMPSEKKSSRNRFFCLSRGCPFFCFALGHEVVHVGQEKYVPHGRKGMVKIHGEIMENERENLIASFRELMEVFALVLHDFA